MSYFLDFTHSQLKTFNCSNFHIFKLSTYNHPHFTLHTFLITSPLSQFSTFTLSHIPMDAGQYCLKHSKLLRDWTGWIGPISECFGTLINHLSLLRSVLWLLEHLTVLNSEQVQFVQQFCLAIVLVWWAIRMPTVANWQQFWVHVQIDISYVRWISLQNPVLLIWRRTSETSAGDFSLKYESESDFDLICHCQTSYIRCLKAKATAAYQHRVGHVCSWQMWTFLN